VLYDEFGKPTENYCAKIEKILKSCSEKYSIPSVLPAPGAPTKKNLIVVDSI
jgi:hypothetical protein